MTAAGFPGDRPAAGMTDFHIAQFNIARARAAMDDPLMAGFMARLDAINAVADASPGFVWRLQDDTGNATALSAYDDPRIIVNLSVWRSLEDPRAFVYRSAHAPVMAQRRGWFEPFGGPFMVLWWVAAGSVPDVAEAKARLATLAAAGPTADAFTFKQPFPAPLEHVS